MFTDFGKMMSDGGVPVYGLVLMGLVGLAIVGERINALYFKYSLKSKEFMKQLRTYLLNDKIEEAISLCASQKTALLPKVIKSILERADRDDQNIHNAHDIATMEVVSEATKNLGYLAMIANVATLVGLLGTIHGLITSFQAVSFADPAQKQTLLAQGISISMNTTALGLVVAIPIMIFYSILQARQNKIIEEIVSSSAKVVDVLVSRSFDSFEEKTVYPGGKSQTERKAV